MDAVGEARISDVSLYNLSLPLFELKVWGNGKENNKVFHFRFSAAVPENSSTGYLLIATSGGLNQQRIGVRLSSNFRLLCFYYPLCYLYDLQCADNRCCCGCLDFECHTSCT